MRARRTTLTLLGLALVASSLLACNFVERQFLRQLATATPVAALTSLAADTLPPATATPVPPRATRAARTPTAPVTQTPEPASSVAAEAAASVRACAFVPGVSTPAVMPPDVLAASTPTPYPLPTLPPNSSVDASVTAQQLHVYQQLWDAVNTTYVYPDFRGHDWRQIQSAGVKRPQQQ